MLKEQPATANARGRSRTASEERRPFCWISAIDNNCLEESRPRPPRNSKPDLNSVRLIVFSLYASSLSPISRQGIEWQQIGDTRTEDAGLTTRDG